MKCINLECTLHKKCSNRDCAELCIIHNRYLIMPKSQDDIVEAKKYLDEIRRAS